MNGLSIPARWLATSFGVLLALVALIELSGAILPAAPIHFEPQYTRLDRVCGDAYGGCVSRVGGVGIVTWTMTLMAGVLAIAGAWKRRAALLGAAGVVTAGLWLPTALAHKTMDLSSIPQRGLLVCLSYVALQLFFAAWMNRDQPPTKLQA